jgi:uncharacterized protein (TIGR02996 family)
MAKRKLPSLADQSDLFSRANVVALAPDQASIPAAEKVLKKGGFGKVEASADGKGWWVVCRGLTDTYQVSVRVNEGRLACACTCPSPKYPCKHALALLIYLHDHPDERAEPEPQKRSASDFEALLRNVFQHPDDDTARLVFADYLDENDQPDRAALIRVQVERAKLSPRSGRARQLAAEEKPLLARVRKAAVDPLPEGVEVEFRRGFIHLTVELYRFNDVGGLPERFARLFREGWVESFHLSEYSYDPLTDEHWRLLEGVGEIDFSRLGMLADDDLAEIVARTEAMRASGRLYRVKVAKRVQKEFDHLAAARTGEVPGPRGRLEQSRGYGPLAPPVFDLLRNAGRFQTVRDLSLEGELGDREAELLAATSLDQLEGLYLSEWRLGPGGVEALGNTTGLPNLATLSIVASPLGKDHVAAMARGPVFARLERLLLNMTGLTDPALGSLGTGLPFPNLTTIELRANDLTATGLAALLRSPRFPALATLDVTRNRIADEELLPAVLDAADRRLLRIVTDGLSITTARNMDGLRLEIRAVGRIGPRFFDGVDRTAAGRVSGVQLLDTRLDAGSLGAIAKAFDPGTLRTLEFEEMRLWNEAVAEFVEAFKDYKLRTIRVADCRMTAAGAAALVESPVVASVKSLSLPGNNIGKAGVAGLLRSTHLTNLERLELTDWMPGYMEDARKALKKKFGKKLVLS